MYVDRTDDFLMFHNAGAFCSQLFNAILFLYDMIFLRTTNDPFLCLMRVFWMLGVMFGLAITAAGGILVNHYVSANAMLIYARVPMIIQFKLSSLKLNISGVFTCNLAVHLW